MPGALSDHQCSARPMAKEANSKETSGARRGSSTHRGRPSGSRPESNSDPDRMAAKRGLAQGMARASAIGEESTAISRTVIEPLLPHQDPALVVRRKLTDPEFSRFTCFVPCSLSRRRMPLDGPSMEGTKRHAGGAIDLHNTPLKPQCNGSRTAKLWVQSHPNSSSPHG